MNISKAIKLSIASAAVVALPGLASAAIDADGNNNMTAAGTLGGWSAVHGTGGLDIVAGSLAGSGMVAGGAPIMDDGFMQRQVTNTVTGDTYIQTVIADSTLNIGSGFDFGTATAAFADESWVKMSSTMGGLLGRSAIQENGTAETFKTGATFQTGGFQGTSSDRSADNVALTQTVADIANDSNGTLSSSFAFNHGTNMTAGGAFNGAYEMVTMDQTLSGHDLVQLDTAGSIASANSLTATFQFNNNVIDGASDTADAASKEGLKLNIGVDINSTDQLTGTNATSTFRIGERNGAAAITGVDGGTWDINTAGFDNGVSSLDYAAGDQIVEIYLSSNIEGAGTFAKSSFNVEGNASPATQNTATFVLSFDDASGPFGSATETNGTADPFIF